ncbi:tyrosine-type recombinase/integrase [Promicromonospora sp. MS192]|uniref:tyrosine-type recombinase/integrase n=1 Tax=Promicromonospora sp. MS192 TaxID=3412684 RepID=UPI003C2E6669
MCGCTRAPICSRTEQWNVGTGRGRRLHELRHTAGCLWLARRIDPGTVQAWCGHESIATTNRYLHTTWGPEPTRRAWIA